MTIPIISVVMPVYNAEKYLDESIQSILNQTYKDFEFIIVNDGSTDKSLDIIKKYQKTDDRIVLIDRENKGLVFSLNEGISIAQGKYIARMDADDISLSSRLDKQILLLEKNENIIACGSWIGVFKNKHHINKVQKFPLNSDFCLARLLFGVPMAHPSVMVDKLALIKLKEKDGFIYDEKMRYIEDYDLWVRLSRYGEYANVQEVLLNYRNTPNSATDIGEKNITDRVRRTINISSRYISYYGLNSFRNQRDKEIYFNLCLNSRIKESSFTQVDYLEYIEHLIREVSNSYQLSKKLKKTFRFYLFKKYLIVIFFKRRFVDAIFRKNFVVSLRLLFSGIIRRL